MTITLTKTIFIRGISEISGRNKNRLIAFIRVDDLLSTRFNSILDALNNENDDDNVDGLRDAYFS